MASIYEKVEVSSELYRAHIPSSFLKFNATPGRPHLCVGLPVSFFKDDLLVTFLMFRAVVCRLTNADFQIGYMMPEVQMTSHKTDIFPKHIKEPLEDADPDPDQVSENEDFAKSKVECICPRCGKMHIMKMRWISH